MRPLLYSINVTLDGCVDHNAFSSDPTLAMANIQAIHRHATETMARADTLLFGRTTYEMMEAAWRLPATRPMPDWQQPFAETIDTLPKFVVSSTLDDVDWNANLLRGNLAEAVTALKQQPGKAVFTGGVKLPMALAEFGLIDEYEFVVQPLIMGRGPSLFAGLTRSLDLKLVDRTELSSGAVALRYVPRT